MATSFLSSRRKEVASSGLDGQAPRGGGAFFTQRPCSRNGSSQAICSLRVTGSERRLTSSVLEELIVECHRPDPLVLADLARKLGVERAQVSRFQSGQGGVSHEQARQSVRNPQRRELEHRSR